MTRDALWHGVQRGKIEQVQRACRGVPALYAIDTLPPQFRTEIYRREPDAKERAESLEIVAMIEPDGAALNFYQQHKLEDGRNLSFDKQAEYANNAAILNALRRRLEGTNSDRAKQSHSRVKKSEFWNKAARALPRVADAYPNSLPANPRRLQEKFNQYLHEGYAALVTGKFGTRNAAVIDTEEKESVLLRLMRNGNNLDNAQLTFFYNMFAKSLNWRTITRATVAVWREKHDLDTSAGRLGETRFNNQKTMQVTRECPDAALKYWTMDGWVAELLYQKDETRDGRQVTTYTNRLTIVIVLDTCCKYPIGYAIGDREKPELIKAALRDAANHTAELFGCRYRVNQLQSDHYSIKALTPTYSVMADKVTPARVHNAKAKVIEPFFKYINKKYCQLCANWAGFGITSNKDLQPNSEYLNRNRKSFPDEAGCRQQLVAIVERERAGKRNDYVASFANLPDERKFPLSDEQYLLAFGEETGYRNALEGCGLRPTIGGVKRDYDCFDPKFRQHAHVRWSVKYDPDNLDTALAINEDGTLRFMLERKHVQPMALVDRTERDTAQLARVNDFNHQLKEGIIERVARVDARVEQLIHDNPQLDVAARLLLSDSLGQNKDYKQTRRLPAREIEDVAAEITTVKRVIHLPVEDENAWNLY
jgi:hypothetical protein